MSNSNKQPEPIALVGSGCRFPGGASSPSKLWDMLLEKRDALKDLSGRFDPQGFYHSNGERNGSLNVKKAYLLEEDVRAFDAGFFGINPREAEAVDPQHRILLETVYEAMEAGGFSIEGMQASDTAVYVGVMTHDYAEMLLRSPENMPTYFSTGTASSILSNRISYFFDWKGPSETIDTACSSSLVAVHRAVQSLRSGESRMAVAGGANLILNPEFMAGEANLHMLSKDSRSRMWDAGANGYARGEGFAAVIMKTLANAIADGDDIQCIIRETGVNSDGRTQGITLPSGEAQCRLIRQVYRRAGLNPELPSDRCQYFEAHGTGTPAGDPIEARGIRDAFFPENEGASWTEDDTLLVGSVKTVVGHTEGTAGLAGLIKAANAIRKGVIAPNMLFQSLNPKLLPLMDHLKLATETQPWPLLLPNQPRRASVNSFGFGGTNAHAIIEHYEPPKLVAERDQQYLASAPLAIPIVLSANSEVSLVSMIRKFHDYIEKDDQLCLNDLAWTLQARRSELAIKATFSGPSREQLLSKMKAALEKADQTPPQAIGQRKEARSGNMRLLGIFTGQGAQWAYMGRDLILASSMARNTVEELDACLAELPDGPSWTLVETLTNKEKPSRLDEAEFAQPICTAVQVMLVDILRSMGISFSAVVGHSSGEIGAAYAAGVVTASEAIKIAYYRGYHTKLAQGPTGQPGTMLAAGLSFEEATEFCSQPSLGGRVQVAASNAPQSVTLSGDVDAINQAKSLLDEKSTFARLLKVNKAYHSRHMEPVSKPYVESLKKCRVNPKFPMPGCSWISSVYGDHIEEVASLDSLTGIYWKDNMLKPVLFSTAVEQAVQTEGPFDLAIEVGPHAALKGPALQTIKQATGGALAYSGTLARGLNDVATLSDSLGFLMNYKNPATFNTDAYIQSFQSGTPPSFLKGLPTYSWDHSKIFWAESRYSRKYRLRSNPRHDLLGARLPDDLEYDMRWQNTLRVTETPWLAGHKVQGQIVYPAAAYLVMVLEASKELSKDQPTKLVELLDVELSRAIPLENDSSGVDTLLGIRKTCEGSLNGDRFVEADFSCFSASGHDAETWDLNVRGRVRVLFADTPIPALPKRDNTPVVLNSLNVEKFYECLTAIGLNYTGLFRRLETIERRMNRATAIATEYPEDEEMPAMIHPALLDAAFQAAFAALHFPEDGGMPAPYLPTQIKSIRVSTEDGVRSTEECKLTIDAYVTDNSVSKIVADLDMYKTATGQPKIQVEGLACTSLERSTASNDCELYTQTVWRPDVSSGIPDLGNAKEEESTELSLVDLCERLTYMYLRQLNAAVSRKEIQSFAWSHQRIFEFIDHLFPIIEHGQHPTIREDWRNDDPAWLISEAAKYPDEVDVQLITAVGKNLLSVVKGETSMLQCMMEDDVLNRYYTHGPRTKESNASLSRSVERIAHRYPAMKILEVGAGTGGATRGILEEIGLAFKSYTFTDFSSKYFARAQIIFDAWASNMKFQTLDIEGDIAEQGFEEQAYDLVIASNISHATQNLQRTMENVRKLLKPGGYVLLREISVPDVLRVKFMTLSLPGWWLGDEDGRHFGPTVTMPQWTTLLKDTGFSGVDQITNDLADRPMYMTSVMLSQAVNDDVKFLREPLCPPASSISLNDVFIIGDNEPRNDEIANYLSESCELLGNGTPKITYIDCIESVLDQKRAISSVIFLQDLDDPIWLSLSERKLLGFKKLFDQARQVLWVTSGCRLQNAYANMSVGFGRALQSEYAHVRFQLLDVEPQELQDSNAMIAEASMRLFADSAVRASSPNLLWTLEPELVVKNGKLLIPRIITDKDLNDRLNSRRRPIDRKVVPSISPVLLTQSQDSYILSEPGPSLLTQSSGISIQVTHSLLSTIRVTDNTYLYLNLGKVTQGGEYPANTQVFAFSNSIGSIISVPSTQIMPVSVAYKSAEKFLQSVATNYVTTALFSQLRHGSMILMFGPDESLASTFKITANALGLEVFLASSMPVAAGSKAVYLNPHTPGRTLATVLPSKIDMFLDFAGLDHSTNIAALEASLSDDCKIIKVQDLFGKQPSSGLDKTPTSLHENLIRAQFISASLVSESETSRVISLSEISSNPQIRPYPYVLDFTKDPEVSVQIAQVQTKGLFRSDKTYLLVGCTGGLGQSLCRWMISNGAKYLALTTRNPKTVNKIWLDELAAAGGEVKIFATDVTDGKSLQKTHEEICRVMPPIAGVANAAMVLSDKLFSDATMEDFDKVLKPKVDGTKQLDELFSSNDLDFFILFSSLANIVGNRGQANYLAANGYMATIAAQRRSRGLVASVMHIGMVLGIGVVSQEGLYESALKRQRWMPISEPNFLNMFSQCVLIGHPDSGHSHEFITGLPRNSMLPGAENPWYATNPRFSHHVLIEGDEDSGSTSVASVPLKQRLAEAGTTELRAKAIQDDFVLKLKRILQTAAENIEVSQPLLALGVDSLMAMEIRSWFMSDVDVDMPVLKILGGSTVIDLCMDAAGNLPAAILSGEVPQEVSNPENRFQNRLLTPCQVQVINPSVPDLKVVEIETKIEPPSPPRSEGSSQDRSTSREMSFSPTPLTTPGREEKQFEWPSDHDAKSSPSDKASEFELDFDRVDRMSFSQERLWFLKSYLSDPTTYNITLAYRVKGKFRVADFEQAFYDLIDRHEILRTAFFTDNSNYQAMQGVIGKTPFVLEQKPLVSQDQIKQEFDRTNKHVYDLERADTMRATLLVESPTSHVLIMGFHHIAVDATSSQILVKDIAMIYAGIQLTPLKYQYIDYASKQRSMVEHSMSKDAAYWKSEFKDIPPTLPFFDFGTVKLRKPLTEYKVRSLETRLNTDITANVKMASNKLRVTPFHVHLATLQTLLHRLLHINDICIGITDANKNDPDHLDTLGFFVNLLPLRFRAESAQSFASLAQQARDKTFQALSHSQLPYDVLLDELKVPRSTTHNPLFQVLMNYRMGSVLQVPLGESQAESVDFEDASNPFDLQFDVESSVDGTTLITISTQEYLYSDADLSTLLKVYSHLLASLTSKPSLAIENHSLFTKQDTQAALKLGKGPQLDLDQSLTVHQLFDRAVKRRSNSVAVVDNLGGSLTWLEMASSVSTIAAHLTKIGIEPEAFVSVYCEPSVKSICYWLAILRVGAIYVPLDVSNPVKRLELIVDDCKPSAIICDDSTWAAAQRFRSRNRHIVKLSDMGGKQPYHINDLSTPMSTACVIYTSGTTGTPKGTLLTNANLVNHILGVGKRFDISEEVVLQPTNLGFDLSLAQMVQFLASQGKLVVASYHSRADPLELVKLMLHHKVTYTIVTPSVYSLLLRQGSEYLKQCTEWRSAFSCGEALSGTVIKDFQRLQLPKLRLINSCGPTEITIINSAWEISLDDPNASDHAMTIGSSLPNYSTYILNEDLSPVPVGFAGEMVCGGGSISRGYLGKKELTATKWVRDPFASSDELVKGWNRMYRTGDKAKLLPDGRFVFLGRIEGDQQVKLRGVRIELEDIAATIVRHAGKDISEAAVSLRGEGDRAFLVAFVVLSMDASVDQSAGYPKKFLHGLPLPSSMIPSKICVLEHLPRTPNGKIDQRSLSTMPLPDITDDEEDSEDVELTTTESSLKEIWTSCLGSVSSVRKTTDFFDAGGNSMLLVSVQAKIRENFGVNVPLYNLFQSSTVENMAAQVEAVSAAENKTAIDWDLETTLDKNLFDLSRNSKGVKTTSNSGLEVLLTGATGFLGATILKELVADKRVAKIHCVAIRLSNGLSSRSLAIESPKITKYYGDLAAPRLGLSDTQFSDLSRSLDRIIHNGADVSFLKSYKSLEKSNFGTTKDLAQLALPRKVPFHFISTAGVAQFVPEDDLPEIFISSYQPAADGSGGYAASKWASEKYLQECYREFDLPVWVHRPSNILGAGAENVNMTVNIIEYSLRIGAVPDTPNLDGFMQFVEVEAVGSGVVQALFDRADVATVIHHCSDDKVRVRDLGVYLEQKYDCTLGSVDLDEWVEQVQVKGLAPGSASLIREVLKNAGSQASLKTLSKM